MMRQLKAVLRGRRLTAVAAAHESSPDWAYPRAVWVESGLVCPTNHVLHQPHPTPWWAGESVFAPRGVRCTQPTGPFFHAVFDQKDETPKLTVGDFLTSPAERKALPEPARSLVADDGCIAYKNYDVHAVYITTDLSQTVGYLHYEVEPIGLMWPDPERPVHDSWCTSKARIVAVHHPPETAN